MTVPGARGAGAEGAVGLSQETGWVKTGDAPAAPAMDEAT